MKQISYSEWKRYLTCPQLHKYHKDGLRPIGTSSALAFGTAIDAGLNAVLLGHADPIQVFKDNFEFDKLSDVTWEKRDVDMRVFTDEQLEKLSGTSLDYQSWATLRVKGRRMIENYISDFMPMIKRVVSVQKSLDDRPGVLDAVLELEGHGVVLIDHKTSARPYDKNAVKASTQLALYAASEGYTKAGFVVLIKANTNKNMQIIIDDIPEMNKNIVCESLKRVEDAIKSGHVYRNLEACGKMYGKPCPYIRKCWNDDSTGLMLKTKENQDDNVGKD